MYTDGNYNVSHGVDGAVPSSPLAISLNTALLNSDDGERSLATTVRRNAANANRMNPSVGWSRDDEQGMMMHLANPMSHSELIILEQLH